MEKPTRERFEILRQGVLKLHKALIDSERVTYEQTIGRIQSPNHFLQLVTQDPWFAWLQPLSLMIVAMDEAADSETPLSAEVLNSFSKEARTLLVPSELGEGFSRHYHDAMQRDPNVVLAHGALREILGPSKPKTEAS